MSEKIDIAKRGKGLMFSAMQSAAVETLRSCFCGCLSAGDGDHPIPKTLGDITAPWMTKAMRKAGMLGSRTKVSQVESKAFDAGQTGYTARLRLSYANEDPSASENSSLPPPVMIVKMNRKDFMGRLINIVGGMYREGIVYGDLKPSSLISAPEHFFSSFSRASKDHVMLVSDAAYIAGIGEVEARSLGREVLLPTCRSKEEQKDAHKAYLDKFYPVDAHLPMITDAGKAPEFVALLKRNAAQLAKMHARYWLDESLFNRDIKFARPDEDVSKYMAFVEDDWPKTKKAVRSGKYDGAQMGVWRGAKDPTAFEEMIYDTLWYQYSERSTRMGLGKDGYLTAFTAEDWRKALKEPGFTLIHGDYHADNLLLRQLPKDSMAPEMSLLDWQETQIGDPTYDIAMVTTFYPGLDFYGKVTYERDILECWWEAFIASGVSRDDLPKDLAWALYKFNCAKINAIILLMCNAIGYFKEDQTWLYRFFVDRFNHTIATLGDARQNWDEAVEILKRMGRIV